MSFRIQCLFFSEFHPIQGPKVSFEYPSGFFLVPTGNEEVPPRIDFDAVSEYIIPKSELTDRFVSV